MKIISADFIKSAVKVEDFPKHSLPQFAFLGRSNCGKSSLINMIVNRKNLVKTGSKPGMTQLVNFFNINNDFVLVDLPGFGYAEVPTAIRNGFMEMIKNFITNAQKLKIVFLLVDIRRKPGVEEDKIVRFLFENNISTAIIATKADKLTKKEQADSIKNIATFFEIDASSVFVSSSKNGNGKREIQTIISDYLS